MYCTTDDWNTVTRLSVLLAGKMVRRFAPVVAASFFAVALQFYLVTSSPSLKRTSWIIPEGRYFCERFDEPYCRCFNPADRTYGLFPNHRNQTARDARREFGHFVQRDKNVIRSNCSDKIGTLLCFTYFPLYNRNIMQQNVQLGQDPQIILPCRELCEEVRRDCRDEFSDNGYPWPDHLDCDKDYFYPWWSGRICINGTDPAQGYDACTQPGNSTGGLEYYDECEHMDDNSPIPEPGRHAYTADCMRLIPACMCMSTSI